MAFTARWVQDTDWAAIERWLASAPELIAAYGLVHNPFTLVATREDTPVAAISVMWGPWGYGMIDWVIRDPDTPRSRGAGSYLCRVAIDTLRGLGMRGVSAVVHHRHQRVLAHDLRIPGVRQQPGEYALINIRFQEGPHGEGQKQQHDL